MQKQCDRLTNLIDGELGRIKLNDKAKGEASGPHTVPVVNEAGQIVNWTNGWNFTVWLEHNVLLGQDPVGVTIPVATLLPTADMVRQITPVLLERARQLRHEQTEEAKRPQMPSMDALRQIGSNGQRPS